MLHYLRFKCKDSLSDRRQVELWGRLALIVDSDIPNVKYLLEVTERGFELNEFMSRMMHYKRDHNRVVAWVKSKANITDDQKK